MAEVQPLLLALASFLRGQADLDAQLAMIGLVLLPALERGLLGWQVLIAGRAVILAVVHEIELHSVAREVLNWGHLLKQFLQSLIEEPVVGITQQLNQVGQRVRLGQPRVIDDLAVVDLTRGSSGLFSDRRQYHLPASSVGPLLSAGGGAMLSVTAAHAEAASRPNPTVRTRQRPPSVRRTAPLGRARLTTRHGRSTTAHGRPAHNLRVQ